MLKIKSREIREILNVLTDVWNVKGQSSKEKKRIAIQKL
jgi:hypothetical protein